MNAFAWLDLGVMGRKRFDIPFVEQKMLANLPIGDSFVRKADDGRRPKAIWEIPVQMGNVQSKGPVA